MRARQGEMRDEDFSGRRVVRGVLQAELEAEVTNSSAESPAFGAAVTCLGDMTSESVKWLWGDQLAVGKVTLFTGASGVGKSFVALRMVADVTRGGRDASADNGAEPGDVLLISPEVELGMLFDLG